MAVSPPLSELCSWKEIASYLGVSVKTAQVWERERGLPVRRLPGPRTQVRALVTELEVWKSGITTWPPAAGAPNPPFINHRKWLLVCVLLVTIAAVVGLALRWPAQGLASVGVVQNSLVGFDRTGTAIWRHDFESLRSTAYSDGERRSWVGDIDGDGRIEVLFVPTPNGLVRTTVPLVCLDSNGIERWRFVPGRRLTRGRDSFPPPFVVRQFAVTRGKILVTSHHHLYYPSQVAVLDADGRLLREYFHPGHLNVLTTGVHRGKPIAILGGVNNVRRVATVVLLDPERLGGATVEHGQPAFNGLVPGVEVTRLMFPRSCLNKRESYNAAVNIVEQSNGLVIDVREELSDSDPASVYYHLDRDFRPVDITVSDILSGKHRRLREAGTLDHDLAAAELASMIKDVIRVP